MASIPGSPAAKLGNEFERLWAVKHLLDVIADLAISVEIDPLGDDERGVEFWVLKPDRTREAHQCKRENGSHGKWSVRDLEAKSIISDARWQLSRDSAHRFVFASADKAPMMSDFVERALQYSDLSALREHGFRTSAGHIREFRGLCKALAADPKVLPDFVRVVEFLRRFQPVIIDKIRQRSEVEEQSMRWIASDPREVVKELEKLLLVSTGKTLSRPDILEHLAKSGMRPCELAKEPSLVAKLAVLRSRFLRSYAHLLIEERPLCRAESNSVFDLIMSRDNPRLILIHGEGGVGKSGVAYELLLKLAEVNILCLPLRLDMDPPGHSTYVYGLQQLSLPASPAACLAAVASGATAVLILDQIDAIRWTSAHSSHAWDTCEELIEEALKYPQVRIVAVCRTFDVEDDPRIRAWKKRAKLVELRVGPLPAETIARTVSPHGSDFNSMDESQRRVLASPQCLYLWWKLRTDGPRPPVFRTMTDLMREFWQMVRRMQRELKAGAHDRVLDEITAFMDRNGAHAAPSSIVANWPDEVAALVSMNVLVCASNERIAFAHQSYLDYLTAERALQSFLNGTVTFLPWVLRGDQPLFRRGQLRHLMALMRDASPELYQRSLKAIFSSKRVRFHLQQLLLQFLGRVEVPTESEVVLVVGLLRHTSWIEHVYWRVLQGSVPWFDALRTRGVIKSWLEGTDEKFYWLCLTFVGGVLEARATEIDTLVLAAQPEECQKRVRGIAARTKPWNLSDRLFAVYLEIARCGDRVTDFIDWATLAKEHPVRSIRLLQVCVLSQLSSLSDGVVKGERWLLDASIYSKAPLEALSAAAVTNPAEAWDLLLPCLESAAVALREQRRTTIQDALQVPGYAYRRHLNRTIRLLMRLLVLAGRELAKIAPDRLWKTVAALGLGKPRVVNRLVLVSISELPSSWSDRIIDWVVEADSRFTCGASIRPTETVGRRYRAVRVILRIFARTCSRVAFRKLELTILAHRPQHEINDFRLCHRLFRDQWNGRPQLRIQTRKLFLGQYLLLTAMPRGRLSATTRDWLGVLARKFVRPGRWLASRSRVSGGAVVSPIPRDRVRLVSNRQWTEIVEKQWGPRPRRWKRMGEGRVAEAAAETFAADLASLARSEPQRIAHLAVGFATTIDARYIWTLFRAFAETKRPENDSAIEEWSPASTGLLEQLVDRFSSRLADREIAGAFTWMLRQRSDETWSDRTYQRAIDLAVNHPDPISRTGNTEREDFGHEIATAGINCVRGQAADAIESIIRRHPDRYCLFRPAVESLVSDPHPAVRVAAAAIGVSMLDNDREAAVELLLRVCEHTDDRVLCNHNVDVLLSHLMSDNHERLQPLIVRMVRSTSDDLASHGAEWVAAVWSQSGRMKDELDKCLAGRAALRRGVGTILAAETGNNRGIAEVVRVLAELFHDTDPDVRNLAASVFRYPATYSRPDAPRLVEEFVESPALGNNHDDLLYGLNELTAPLRPFAKAIAHLADDIVAGNDERQSDRPRRWWEAGQAASVLLRLYEQSENDRSTRLRCLDVWDRLLRHRFDDDVLRRLDH